VDERERPAPLLLASARGGGKGGEEAATSNPDQEAGEGDLQRGGFATATSFSRRHRFPSTYRTRSALLLQIEADPRSCSRSRRTAPHSCSRSRRVANRPSSSISSSGISRIE
jgi:hypothetical protein